MIKEKITIYKCEFCGVQHTDEAWMKFHEEYCPKNPQNQPCSECMNCIINPFTGRSTCNYNIDMENIGGNVLCFKYSKGVPAISLNTKNEEKED